MANSEGSRCHQGNRENDGIGARNRGFSGRRLIRARREGVIEARPVGSLALFSYIAAKACEAVKEITPFHFAIAPNWHEVMSP